MGGNTETMNSKSGVFQLKPLQVIWKVAEHVRCSQFYSSKIFHPSFCLSLDSHLVVHTKALGNSGFRSVSEHLYSKKSLENASSTQARIASPCPAVTVVNISNVHDVWTSSKWLTHTLSLLKNFSVCPPAVQVWRGDERHFPPWN